jgi:hypothetical protein
MSQKVWYVGTKVSGNLAASIFREFKGKSGLMLCVDQADFVSTFRLPRNWRQKAFL